MINPTWIGRLIPNRGGLEICTQSSSIVVVMATNSEELRGGVQREEFFADSDLVVRAEREEKLQENWQKRQRGLAKQALNKDIGKSRSWWAGNIVEK